MLCVRDMFLASNVLMNSTEILHFQGKFWLHNRIKWVKKCRMNFQGKIDQKYIEQC